MLKTLIYIQYFANYKMFRFTLPIKFNELPHNKAHCKIKHTVNLIFKK